MTTSSSGIVHSESALGANPDRGTMAAAVYRRFGPPEVVRVERTAKPRPKANEVLIKVHASTVSAADFRSRSRIVPQGLGVLAAIGIGLFRPRFHILGMDAAGVVEAVGAKVTAFRPGDQVIAMLGGKFGGHAEYACIPEDGAITAMPDGLSFQQAATLVFGGITARAFLRQATIQPGDRVLVNGASGAVGTAAVQLAKHLGAHVTGVTSGRNVELVASLGADRVVDYTTTDFTAGADTYDVIVDCVGNATFDRVEALINPGGKLLLVIADLRSMLRASRQSRRSGKLVATTVGKYRAEDLAHVADLAASGGFRPVIDRTYELGDIVEAHRYVDGGHKKGNVVLQITAG
jgi:NADPH:quinone reductase-like Zn-dependent oxidoreductase